MFVVILAGIRKQSVGHYEIRRRLGSHSLLLTVLGDTFDILGKSCFHVAFEIIFS